MSVIGSEREGAKVLQAKAAAKERKGPHTDDVCSMIGIVDPPCPEPLLVSNQRNCLCFGQILANPLPPHCRRHMYVRATKRYGAPATASPS